MSIVAVRYYLQFILSILNYTQAVEKFGATLFNFYKSRGIMRAYADAVSMCESEGEMLCIVLK